MSRAASADLVPALRTELGSRFEMGPAALALRLGAERLAAFGAEFRALRAGAAARAKRGGLGGQVHSLREILLAQLFAHLLDLRLHLRGGEFGLDVGSAVITEHALVVPTGGLADPVAAFGTLAEVRLCLLDSRPKGAVVTRALDGSLDLVGGISDGSEDSPENAAHRAQRAARHPRGGGLEGRLEPVAAPVAKELELIPTIGRVIGVVAGELNEAHNSEILAARAGGRKRTKKHNTMGHG